MEKLKFTDLKTSKGKMCVLKDLAAAAAVSVSFFMCLNHMFGFSYTLGKGFGGGFPGGLVKTWNMAADALGNYDFILLPKIAGETAENGLFLTICAVMMTFVAFMIVRSKSAVGMLVFVLPAAALDLFFRLPTGEKSVVSLTLAVLFAVLYMKGEGESLIRSAVWVLLIGAAAWSLLHLPAAPEAAGRPAYIKDLKNAAWDFVSEIYYGENPLKSGDLSRRQRPEEGGAALKIKMEKPHSMYLRGFIGDVYNGKRWEALSDSVYYGAAGLMERLGAGGFEPLGQISRADELAGHGAESGKIRIKAVKADKRYVYIPYELKSFEREYKVKGGNFVAPGKLKRNVSYVYTAGDNSVKHWTDTAAGIFEEAERTSHKREDLIRYFIDESHYNEFVYGSYTYVSSQDSALLAEYFPPEADQTQGHADYKAAINKIRGFLEENFIYTENLGKRPERDMSPLQEFLESRKGYDIHYATAAAIMFRYFGIPARYAEGYLVTPADVKKAGKDGEISVGRKRAHAWAEIYIDGTGFVPVEVTPPYRGIMEEADMDKGISGDAIVQRFEPRKEETAKNGTAQGGDNRKHGSQVPVLLLLVPGALLLIILVYGVIRLILLGTAEAKRRRLFRRGEPKLAVSAIYGYMEKRDYEISGAARDLGNRAAYSRESISETQREEMLRELKKERKRKKVKQHEKKIKRRCDFLRRIVGCGFNSERLRRRESGG